MIGTGPPEPVPAVASVERWPDAGPERDGLIPLDRNERLGPLPDWFLAELQAQLTSARISNYPSPEMLRKELSGSLGIARERLLVTAGADGALRALHLAFVRPGDAVVRLDPTYAMVSIYAQIFGAREVPIGYDADLQFDTGRLLDAVEPGVRLAVIANPNQPTGTLLPPEALDQLLARCERVGALLVLDETYQAFAGVTALPLVARSENIVVLRSFSKAAGLAGLRIGFAVAAPSVIQALATVRSAGEINALALEAARLVVSRPEVVDDYVKLVEEARSRLEEHVRPLGVEPLPTHANFVVLRLPAGADPAEVVNAVRERGYLVKGPFASTCLAGCIRVTLGPPALMVSFSAALAEALG